MITLAQEFLKNVEGRKDLISSELFPTIFHNFLKSKIGHNNCILLTASFTSK
jgi:hypothetical protein